MTAVAAPVTPVTPVPGRETWLFDVSHGDIVAACDRQLTKAQAMRDLAAAAVVQAEASITRHVHDSIQSRVNVCWSADTLTVTVPMGLTSELWQARSRLADATKVVEGYREWRTLCDRDHRQRRQIMRDDAVYFGFTLPEASRA
jgi:hypothetical protein